MTHDGASWDPRVPLSPLRPDDPAQFGQYRVLGRLGSGGLGDAFLAQDAQRWVVIKAVRPGVADTSAMRARLAREIRAVSLISSPFVAAFLDSDLEATRPWFAMEFVPGITLERQVSEDGPLRPVDLSRFAHSLAEALAAVHAAGVIHRDLKPANIMLSPEGPRLIDFGIADVTGSTRLTQDGASLGTLFWMSPEQVIGERATTATDVHAWGLVTYFAATGQPPFTGENSVSAMYQVLNVVPPLPPGFPPDLAAAIDRALAKDPRRRPSVPELLGMLEAPAAFPPGAASASVNQYWATPQPGVQAAPYLQTPGAPPPPGPVTPMPPAAPGPATPVPPVAQPWPGAPAQPPGMVPGPMGPGAATPPPGTWTPAYPPGYPPPGSTPTGGPKKGHRSRNLVLAGVGAVVLVGLVGVIGLVAMSGGGDPGAEPSSSSSSSTSSTSGSASASASATDAAWEQATTELTSYQSGEPGQWSDAVPGKGDWNGVAVQGLTGKDSVIRLHTYLAEEGATPFWMYKDEAGSTWGGFTDFQYKYIDSNGKGRKDILVRAKQKEDGNWVGAVALAEGKFALFSEDGKQYTGYENLDWVNDQLVLTGDPTRTFTFSAKNGTFTVKVK